MKKFRRHPFNPALMMTLLFGFMAGCCSSLPYQQATTTRWADNSHNVENFMHSTVAIINPATNNFGCSGFFISPELILTARHCYDMGNEKKEDLLEMYKVLQEDELYVVSYDTYKNGYTEDGVKIVNIVQFPVTTPKETVKERDFVLLKLKAGEKKSKHWLPMAKKNPVPGEKVYNVSLPRGMPWLFIEGVVSQYYYSGKDNEGNQIVGMLGVSIPITFGSSGSAIVDKHGRIVGLAHKIDETKHNAIFIPVERLNTFVYGWALTQRK